MLIKSKLFKKLDGGIGMKKNKNHKDFKTEFWSRNFSMKKK